MAIDPDVQVLLDEIVQRIEALEAGGGGSGDAMPTRQELTYADGTTIVFVREPTA